MPTPSRSAAWPCYLIILVIPCLPHCKYMAKLMQVAPLDRIHQDCSMHILVDKVRRTVQALFSTCTLVDCTTPACQGEGIRRMVRGGRGSIAGVEGLGFIELEGHAEPVGILTEPREVAAACTALQEVGCLQRDAPRQGAWPRVWRSFWMLPDIGSRP